VIELIKRRERRFVGDRIVVGKITQFFWSRHRSPPMAAVKVFDPDIDLG
jgi:hypothetical protein